MNFAKNARFPTPILHLLNLNQMKRTLLVLFLLLSALGNLQAQNPSYPWFNEKLPLEERVDLLIDAMTIEEKVSQMMDESPAIERLGVPQYHWWNECLHGVARAGLATVYPQAIALAATFDEEALYQSATIISDEARAKHHHAVRSGQRGQYQGLTFWSPNINIFRDPRWGRGQETYGEDPYLSGRMGCAFVRGLQGDNPEFYKLVATAKHFAVHSGPEYERHTFDARVSDYDLWDTYLPAFRMLVKEAGVHSVMCAYNRFEGEPCCGSDKLELRILRDYWKFPGYIVSDCGAITDFYRSHKVEPDAESASADAVKNGTDLECGSNYQKLTESIRRGLIAEEEIDAALRRLFLARFKLGMFTPDAQNPYASIPYSVVDCESHRRDALEMARKSIVLLKNQDRLLPLSRNLRKIALIGPAADDSVSLLGNYNGTPGHRVTILEGLRNKCGSQTEIVYKKGVNFLDNKLFEPFEMEKLFSNGGHPGLKAEYFNNTALQGQPLLTRVERTVDFEGSEDDEIAPGIRAQNISVRWSGTFTAPKTQTYTFQVSGDDGYRLYIDGKKVIDDFKEHEETTARYEMTAEEGRSYDIRLEYFQGSQGAAIHFSCGKNQATDYAKLAVEVADADVILFAGGISPLLEGEEMKIDVPGFYKGDRTSIALPAVQTEMIKALEATGKPVVLILQTGSALATPWESENLPALLNVWYGGQEIGSAVADVLFGDYNPAGRLPITFYKSDADLPDYHDYAMRGRTYRYFDKEPLYPFGYGLSYTSFRYSDLKAPRQIQTGKDLKISCNVTNTGERDGDEVVQLYVSHPRTYSVTPIRSLKGFKRIHLKKGESRKVEFSLTPRDLGLVNDAGRLIENPSRISLFIGGGQPGHAEGAATEVRLTGQSIVFDY